MDRNTMELVRHGIKYPKAIKGYISGDHDEKKSVP